MTNEIQLAIAGKDVTKALVDGIEYETQRKGAPSTLNFTVLGEVCDSFTEGNNVQLAVNGTKLFNGFVFSREHDKLKQIKVLCYDQLRYLKNKDTYVYLNKSATEVINMVAADFGLQLGSIADTGFKIAARDEDNQTLFDIILNALDLTTLATNKLYVLYDDFGKITLKPVDELKLDCLISQDTCENYEYGASIDKDTYNKAKVIVENSKSSTRDVYDEQDDTNVQKWGVLQYFMKVSKNDNAQALCNTILKAKNRKIRTLSAKGIIGDLRVRAGYSLPVKLELSDGTVNNEYLMCETVKHHIFADRLSMDIEFYNLKDTGV